VVVVTESRVYLLTEPVFQSDAATGPDIRLPPQSRCLFCREVITLAREVPLARQVWELIEPLRPDADTINVERHLPTHFQLAPPRPDTSGIFPPGYSSVAGVASNGTHHDPGGLGTSPRPVKSALPSPSLGDPKSIGYPGPVSPLSPNRHQPPITLRSESSRQDVSVDPRQKAVEEAETIFTHIDSSFLTDPPPFSRDSPALRRQTAPEETASIHTPRTMPLITQPADKGKSRWRLKFSTTKKAPMGASGDSSSLSSSTLEAQKRDEIPLSALMNTQKGHTRGKPSKNINFCLSQNSTLGLFWTQLLIQLWDVGTSPPSMIRAILPESTCILAAVARTHLAYIIGTRDQKLTVSIDLGIISAH